MKRILNFVKILQILRLTSMIKEKEDFTNKLRKQRNSLENEVKHLNTNIEQKNEDILHIEFSLSKQKEISGDKVKAIGFENDDLTEKLDAANVRIETLEKVIKNNEIKEISMEKKNDGRDKTVRGRG